MSDILGNNIEYIDQTIRDAQQSLWGNMMTTEMILPIAATMDKVGYTAIGFSGGRAGTVATRSLKESLFQRCRDLSKIITKTPIRSSVSSWSPFSFAVEPVAANELWIKLMVSCGIRSFWFCHYQNLLERERHLMKVIKAEGAEVVGGIMYTYSPVHTDELWAKKTCLLMDSGLVDRIMMEDAGGVLVPERTPGLVKAIISEARGVPVEWHSHCNLGMAPAVYVAAMQAGIRAVHTAAGCMGNGTSLPAAENTIKNAKVLGLGTNLNLEVLKAESDYFRKEAETRGKRQGVPQEFDYSLYTHQIPGGMMGTMRNQLAELKLSHRMDDVLVEAALVRKDLGYPVMATPYSQFVGAQALWNVTSGARYRMVSDEVIRYMLGHYGQPDGLVDQNVKDKVLAQPKAKKWAAWQEPNVTVDDLRKLDPSLTDDELMLKLSSPEGEFRDKLRKLYGWP
jgi:oxaloacetate decarboxylase alpha subunit